MHECQRNKRKFGNEKNGSQANILASAADELADIIYEAIKHRERKRMDSEITRPLKS